MNEDLENQPPTDAAPQDEPSQPIVETPPAADAVENVTINRADYDRLTQASQVAQELAPIADLIRQDPTFAERLRTAAAGPAPVARPPLNEQVAGYEGTFYDNPALTSAAIAKTVIDSEYAPQLQAQARSFQLQFNKMAIANFRQNKVSSDSFAAGILPIFDQTIAKTSDNELSLMDANRLNSALSVAYDMATGQYFRTRAGTVQKDQPPPLAGAGAGASAGARAGAEPNNPDWELLQQQAAALRISPEKLREMWKASEDEEKRGVA